MNGRWSSPTPVRTPAELREALRAALKILKPATQRTCLVLSHAELGSILVETPPASEAVAHTLVERALDRQKTFDGPATWTGREVLLPDGERARAVFFVPRGTLDQTKSVFREVGLHLTSCVPASEVARLVAQADAGPDAGGSLAMAMIPGALVFSLSHRGCGVLQRNVPVPIDDPERWMQELRRTVLFARQHHRIPVSDVRFLGTPAAYRSLERLAPPDGVVLHQVEALEDGSWSRWLLENGVGGGANLLEGENKPGSSGQWVGRIAPWSGRLALVLSLLLAVALEGRVRREKNIQGPLRQELATLDARVQSAQAEEERLRNQAEILEVWDRDQRPAVFLGLTAELGRCLPEQMVLSRLELLPAGSSWTLKLTGVPTADAPRLDPGKIATFRRQLAGPPLRLLPPGLPTPDPSPTDPRGNRDWVRGLVAAGSRPNLPTKTIQVEGTIR